MAIILPNTRNAIGVPNRYSDLAAAGLRYTPPPVYRYDAYDVQGDEATLYEEGIDLADYQYNEDGYDAAVLPAGYIATTGGDGRILVGSDTKLYQRDIGGIGPVSGSPSGFSYVAKCVKDSGPAHPFLAIQDGKPFFCYFAPGLQMRQLDDSAGWDKLSFATECYSDVSFLAAKAGALLVAYYNFETEAFVANTLSAAQGWKISGGFGVKQVTTPYGLDYENIGSFVISPSGQLYLAGQNLTLQDVADGWMSVSGYVKSGAYSALEYAYGIRAGELWALGVPGIPHTRIGTFSDWWRVTFVAPDEAVAIRRIAL